MPSRVEHGRDLARRAKLTLAVVAAAGFACGAVLARESHPGGAASSGVTQQDGGTFDLGGGSLQPSFGESPQVQSGAS